MRKICQSRLMRVKFHAFLKTVWIWLRWSNEKNFPQAQHLLRQKNVKVFSQRSYHTMTVIDTIALILVTIGALNWGSIGIFGIDAIGTLFGGQLSLISRLIYTVVALAGIWTISIMFKNKVPSDTRVESRK